MMKNILRIGIPTGLENGMFQIGKILVASLITLAFSLCIERLLTRKVHGINMVEALKSVE